MHTFRGVTFCFALDSSLCRKLCYTHCIGLYNRLHLEPGYRVKRNNRSHCYCLSYRNNYLHR